MSSSRRSGTVQLTDRDQQILHSVWSLGAAPASALRAVHSPGTAAGTFRDRLRKLHQAGLLDQHRYIAPAGDLWLYSLGPAARHPGEPRPWRPGLAQLQHTLQIADALVALTRPGFAHPRQILGWQGEAEIRAWAPPGAPYPDARISWQHQGRTGQWQVELDRATESRPAWRRKLARYLSTPSPDPILAITTSDPRATHLALLAADVGVPLLATTLHACRTDLDPLVLDTRSRQRLPLSRT
jgi:hypothetical protein